MDALDENRYASEFFDDFKSKLEDVMEPFGLVMITCRDQFFDNEKSIPTSTNWVSVTKDKSLISYNKIYISPFSDEDIKKYLTKKYRNRKKRKQAMHIANGCKALMARPLLLSYMDDLLDGHIDSDSLCKTYSVLIDKWLQREVNKIQSVEERKQQKEQLYLFSVGIAKMIYENWKDTKSMLLSPEQMQSFMEHFHYTEVPYQMKRRSLINRNVSGYYKFAHKSFLEYFLAQEHFYTPTFMLDFEGMDMARRFYEEMCKAEFVDWQVNGYLKLNYSRHKMFGLEVCLNINLDYELDYVHLADALEAMNLTLNLVSFTWNIYGEELHRFLLKIKVPNIEILSYNNVNDKTPRKLLELQDIVSISFISQSEKNLPKKFVVLAQKKNILALLNGNFVTLCDVDSRKLPANMSVNYNMNRRQILLQKNRIEDFFDMVNYKIMEDKDND